MPGHSWDEIRARRRIKLDDLLGLCVVEGVREVTSERGGRVLLVRIDGEVYAILATSYGDAEVVSIRDRWPFEPKHDPQRDIRMHGEEIEASGPKVSRVCHVIRRPNPPSRSEDWRADVICAIDEATGLVVFEIGMEPDDLGERILYPISSGGLVSPGESTQIVGRCSQCDIRPEFVVIGGAPGDWHIDDIRIGDRSQVPPGGVSGEVLVARDRCLFSFIRQSEDFRIQVSYVGYDPRGASFFSAIVGNSCNTRSIVMNWDPDLGV